jgi:alkaline phosphatase D
MSDAATGAPSGSASTSADATTSSGSGPSDGSSTGPGEPGLPPVPDPGPPDFPEVIDYLTIAVRTADSQNAGTDNNALSVCITATDCRRLDIADVDDFRIGEIDVYHFAGMNVSRADVDRIELRSADGVDAWRPACVEVRFDGEPVHCENEIDVWLGNDAGETESWIDPAGLHEDCTTCYPSPLTHGPMRGAIDHDRTRIWIRTEATRGVGLRMSSEPDLTDAPVVAWAYPRPADDFTAVLEVPDVPGDTAWHYGLQVDGELLDLSTHPLSMPPAPGTPVSMSFAFGSCARLEDQPIFTLIEQLEPDLFLFVGDNHYANSNDLEAVRWFYRRDLANPPRAAFVERTPTIATWDDHDFVGNNTDGTDPLKTNSLQAFTEYWANPSYGTEETPGVFTIHRYGDLDFILVDDRYYRNLEADSMLGSAQRQWLIESLAASTATFKFVVSGSVWTEHGSSDSWAAFLDERNEIFDAVRERSIAGIVLMAGDIHRSQMRWIEPVGGGYPLPELTSSPLANTFGNCAGQPDWLSCVEDNSFILVDVDTTAADPMLHAVLYDHAGVEQFELMVTRSQLQ